MMVEARGIDGWLCTVIEEIVRGEEELEAWEARRW